MTDRFGLNGDASRTDFVRDYTPQRRNPRLATGGRRGSVPAGRCGLLASGQRTVIAGRPGPATAAWIANGAAVRLMLMNTPGRVIRALARDVTGQIFVAAGGFVDLAQDDRRRGSHPMGADVASSSLLP